MRHWLIILLLLLTSGAEAQTFTSEPIAGTELCRLHLSHYDFEGREHVGEMVCNRAIAQDLVEIFRALHEAHYPIEKMRPMEEYDNNDEASMADNNTSCYCNRNIQGTNRPSRHSLGMAVDVNPRMNPCVHLKTGLVEPANAGQYVRNRKGRGIIDTSDLCYRLFVKHGFRWGGAWKTKKDYQHFEK